MYEPNQQDVTPPDLVSAGGDYPVANPASMIDAMRSHGSPPAGLMAALQPPQMTGLTQAAAAATGGLNPLQVNPLTRQQNIQQEMQMQQAQLIQRAQEHQQRLGLEKNRAAFDVLGGIINNPNTTDETMKALAPQYQRMAKDFLGVDIPASALGKVVSQKDRNSMLQDLYEGFTPQQITKNYPWVKAEDIPGYQAMLQKPEVLKKLGYSTPDELENKRLDLQIKQETLFDKQHPELKDKDVALYATTLAQKMFGVRYTDATEAQQAQIAEIAKLKSLQDGIDKENRVFSHQSALQTQRDIAAENRAQISADRALNKTRTLAEEKRLQSLVVADTFVNQFEDYIPKLSKAKFLPSGTGFWADKQAAAKRIMEPNDPDWRGWLELQGNMIGFARSVQNDIGPRAMAAFQRAVDISERPPTEEGLRQIVAQMRNQIEASKKGKAQEAVTAAPGTVLNPGPPPGFKKVD